MENRALELQSVLESQLQLHGELIKIAENMNQAIKEKKLKAIRELTGKFDEYIGQVESLESKRLKICDAIAASIKTTSKHLNLQSVIRILPDKFQKTFTTLKKELKKKMLSLHKINTSNQILLDDSLLVIKKEFDIMTQFHNRLSGYEQSGAMVKESVRKNIVNHIA